MEGGLCLGGRHPAVPVGPHGNAPLAAFRGGEYLPASVILQLVGGTNMKDINATKLGRALTAMGFESKMTRGIRRYRVVRRSTSEMQQHRQLLNVDSESGGVVE